MAWLSIQQLHERIVRWLLPIAWVAVVAAGVVLIVRVQDYLQRPLGVFPTYYTAAKLIERGERVANFYDDGWFMDRVPEFAPGVTEVHNANPPLLGFFFLPLTPLSYQDARQLMSALGFIALVAATYLMITELQIVGLWRPMGFLAVFVAAPSAENLGFAQVYPVVLLMLVLAWRAWRKHADEFGGSLIGIVLCWKTAGLFLWPLMVLERRWRALAAGVGAVVTLSLITLPFVGIDGWLAYFHYASGMIGAPHIAIGSRISVPGIVQNFFAYDAEYNPDPYFDAPVLAWALEVFLFLAISGTAARIAVVASDRDITYSLFIMVSLILVPVTHGTHLCLAFLPAFVIFSRIRQQLISPLGAWFLLGGVLSFARGYERVHALAAWGGPVFFYPRLAGMIILLGLLIVLGLRSSYAERSFPRAARA